MLEQSLKILRVPRDADMETVRRAYVKQTRRYPPEHFPEKYKRVKHAYEQLRLERGSIEPLAKGLAQGETTQDLFQAIFEEALSESKGAGSENSLSVADFEQLGLVLNQGRYRQEVLKALEEIGGEMASSSGSIEESRSGAPDGIAGMES